MLFYLYNYNTFPAVFLQTFAKAFEMTPDDLDMHIIYDVSHNIAKVEEHISLLGEGKRERAMIREGGYNGDERV